MANAILAYGNLADSATLSKGSWLSALPLTNLQDRRLGKVARSSSTATSSTKFDADFGGTKIFRVVSLVNHNFSLTATYRIRLSADADFATTTYDSGWVDVWPVIYPLGALPWGSPNWWTGRYTESEVTAYTGTLVCILNGSTAGRYLRVEIDDTDNLADYVQIGRLFAADGWQPGYNMEYGASLGWDARSEIQEALSGAEYFNVRPSRRVTRFQLPALDEDEAMARIFEIQRGTGVTGEVLFVWDPEDTTHAIRRQFLGRLRTLSAIENPGPNRWRAPFEIAELL